MTKEGEVLPFYQQEMKVGGDGEDDRIFFIWPTTIVHKIDEDSPLYNMSATDMIRQRFEIVVILEGMFNQLLYLKLILVSSLTFLSYPYQSFESWLKPPMVY